MCLGANYWAKLEPLYYANTKEDTAEASFDVGFIYKVIAKTCKKEVHPSLIFPKQMPPMLLNNGF